jgi:hypothetical protein
LGAAEDLISLLGINVPLPLCEQPGADDAEDAGDEEPGAALRAARAAGQGGDEEGEGENSEDVFGRHERSDSCQLRVRGASRPALKRLCIFCFP